MISVVRYSPEVEKPHFEFATRYWTKRKRITPEYLYWKFRGTPEKPPSLLLAKIDEKVVGQLGLIPCVILLGNRKVAAQWACDLMVDNQYRGQGIAMQLYEFAFALKPVTLGSDPSPAASVSMKRAGFTTLRGPRKFAFPMSLGEVAKLKGLNSNVLDRTPNPFLFFLKLWHSFRKSSFKEMDAREYTAASEEIPESLGYSAWIEHSGDFVDWRFNSFMAYYNGIKAYRDRSGSIYSEYLGPDVVIITEHLGRTRTLFIDLLSDSIRRGRRHGIRQLKILAYDRSQARIMTFLGFVPFRTPTEIIFHCGDPAIKEQMSKGSFYYTYLDSDENI